MSDYPDTRHRPRTRASFVAVIVSLTLSLQGVACGGRTFDSAAGAGDERHLPIRAMTFNIRYGTAPDGENAWTQRRHLTFRVIREHAPHVLGLQEALRFQLDEIADEFPGFGEIGVGRDDGDRQGEYSAILYASDRLEALEHGTFWLSDRPAQPGSMTWGNRYPRLVTWARFRDVSAGDTFYVYNTHWDHEVQRARELGAQLMLDRIAGRSAPDPLIVMGDFNAGEHNPAFLLLLNPGVAGVRLYDTFRERHPHATEVGTFHAFRGERSGPKIDAILASPEWRTLDAAIVHLSQGGVYPSDHYPVTATLARATGRSAESGRANARRGARGPTHRKDLTGR